MGNRGTRCGPDGQVLACVLTHMTAKWSIPVLHVISTGERRFNRLHRSVPGISHQLLSVTLRRLEEDGLIARTVRTGRPPTVEYRTTDLGRRFVALFRVVEEWADTNGPDLLAARERDRIRPDQVMST